MKLLLFIIASALLRGCAGSNFDVIVEDTPLVGFEHQYKSEEHGLLLNLYSGSRDELILFQKGLTFNAKIESIKGKLESHPLQKLNGKRMHYPSFNVFQSDSISIIFERRQMNDKMYVVNEQRVVDYFEQNQLE
ncbi:hypothetical protein [Carboxylicivirga sp. M1479]|uniref:hypothetical protein n=1 Tax=Carboxylicivirga sp. M1479 TaxID=2594476 RepID=UPI00117790C8|nr:hypothetical protein [Carboxylicivirga sp. M1479]TRX72587.1 hypothetical protein FNN09_01220 [Carboxylicivirga sp. M1479]